jgi:serine/threonine protein kinase
MFNNPRMDTTLFWVQVAAAAKEMFGIRAEMCVRVIDAIWAFHYRGLQHCDVKLENFVVGQRYCALIDLGQYVFEGTATWQELTEFTPGYLDPKCFQEPEAEAKFVDTWAMGVTLYTMLQGQPPYCPPGEFKKKVAWGEVVWGGPYCDYVYYALDAIFSSNGWREHPLREGPWSWLLDCIQQCLPRSNEASRCSLDTILKRVKRAPSAGRDTALAPRLH